MQLKLSSYLTIHHIIVYASLSRTIKGNDVPAEGSAVLHAIASSNAGQIRVNPPRAEPTTVVAINNGHTITGKCGHKILSRKYLLITYSHFYTNNSLWIGLYQQRNDRHNHRQHWRHCPRCRRCWCRRRCRWCSGCVVMETCAWGTWPTSSPTRSDYSSFLIRS